MWNPRPTLLATPQPTAELDRLGDEIAELSAHLDAATARLLTLIREFDARGGWNTGFPSCAEWLGWRVGLNKGAAREWVRVARALGTLPRLTEALARGQLSYSKVRALTRVATPETEARLLAVGRAGTAEHVGIVQAWRQVDRRAEARKAARHHEGRGLQVYEDEDGMVVVRGRLTPEAGALLRRALEAGREVLYQNARRGPATVRGAEPAEPVEERPTVAQQQADALALVAESALHHALDPGAPGERYQVVVHVDAAVLADRDQPGQSALEDGAHVPAGTSHRLACDASRVVVRHDKGGRVVEIGARTRTIPPALRRALLHRDRTCRFPGAACGLFRPIISTTGRRAARQSSPIFAPAAVRQHRQRVHQEGYEVARGPRRDASISGNRDARLHLLLRCLPAPAGHSVAILRARHDAEGLRIGAKTAHPDWLGERLDLGWAIDALHPRANPLRCGSTSSE